MALFSSSLLVTMLHITGPEERNVNVHPENVNSPYAGPLIYVASFFCHFPPLFQRASEQLRFR
jgi:hypothetical protein